MSDNPRIEIAKNSKAWPLVEATAIYKRINGKTPEKGYVLFETGYGPSGLPHIGTFGEVARTTMVMHAFQYIAPDIPVRLFCISDDLDGLRKVPDNIPNSEMVAENLDKPLTQVPDPFGTHPSYGDHMNARLCAFLDSFGFEYEFKSATELYKNGTYDDALLAVLQNYEKVMKIMLPTLGAERQKTYSPFLPISPISGKVLQVPMVEIHKDKGTVVFEDEDGSRQEVPVTGGHCKLQWKPDLGMRWAALDVDFEMYGKDHLVNGPLYSKICNAIGGNAPHQYFYELFLDEKGQKISKSKGNGISMEEWLRYAPPESLSYYMYQNPRTAKRLYFDVIPKAMDEYFAHLAAFERQDETAQLKNPTWHIHKGSPPKPETSLSFALLLNLASACHAENSEVLWGFIARYAPDATPENSPVLNALAKHAVVYYHDFVKPNKEYRQPNEAERKAFKDLAERIRAADTSASGEELQNIVYAVGTEYGFEPLRSWFGALYEVLLGQKQGPRFGSFIELFGREETANLINKALKGEDLAA